MEIPTFVLGISILFPRTRNSFIFAVSFFVTRILFHIILGISFMFKENRNAVTGGSFLPAILFACIPPIHVAWFVGCIKGFIRRARQKTTPVSRSQTVAPELQPSTATSTPPFSVSSIVPALLLRLTYCHQTFERILWSLQYELLKLPTSKRSLIFNAISAYLPCRETLYEWVGLGQRQRRRLLTSD
ncbi:hypothetical protein E4T56_gene15096 [Termitomyces sp. T112]|nr:hypothetical protein E4T56_gene15096 [Termitomyces sp. T112]